MNGKIENVVRYCVRCGVDEAKALERAKWLVEKGDHISAVLRGDAGYCVENFSCFEEFQGWKEGNVISEYSDYVLLDAYDPFYNSIWGQIEPKVAAMCCGPVRDRIAVGM